MKRCYYCGKIVPEDEHLRVRKAVMSVCGEVCDNDTHIAIAENVFVHLTGVRPECLDDDGTIVVCSECFVRELAAATP